MRWGKRNNPAHLVGARGPTQKPHVEVHLNHVKSSAGGSPNPPGELAPDALGLDLLSEGANAKTPRVQWCEAVSLHEGFWLFTCEGANAKTPLSEGANVDTPQK